MAHTSFEVVEKRLASVQCAICKTNTFGVDRRTLQPDGECRAVCLKCRYTEGHPEVVYPLDPELLKRVLEIERVIAGLEGDLETLRGRGIADDILTQTIHKLVARARESLSGRLASDFTLKRLDMTRGSLVTTWRQVRSRLRQA